jgi:glycosyltransferase involved in cell wall biosynthesis
MKTTALSILGLHPGNGHLSINNYYDYCRIGIPPCLPGWTVSFNRPGPQEWNPERSDHRIPKTDQFVDYYLRWPRLLRSLCFDVAHMVDQNAAWYRLFLTKGRTVVTVHDLIPLMVMRNKLPGFPKVPAARAAKIRFNCAQIRQCDRIVCVSSATANAVVTELGVESSKITVIPNVVPDSFRGLPGSERGSIRSSMFGSTEFVLLHVGRASNYKNRIAVVKVFDRLISDGFDARLALTADALSDRELSVISSKETLKRISVFTPASTQELAKLYNASDLFLFPSLFEGFGWPPIEAMACGCPVVSSSRGSLSEVVGNAAAKLKDPSDEDELYQLTSRLLRSSVQRAELVSAGYRWSRRYSFSSIMPQLASVYEQVV